MRLTRRAESKIYRAEQPAWDGKWLLLLSEGLDKSTLADVKKQLIWQGFGALAPSLMASPSQKLADVQTLLHEAGVADNVICFEAQIPLALSRAALRARVEECWHLTEQNAMYETFIQSFRPLVPLLKEAADELTPERAFHIQLLLIHFYRRVVLKDPLLPEELLPAHWAGHTARQLCINIYQRVAPAALAFVSEKGETSVGELPAPGSLYFQRFGGLNIEQERYANLSDRRSDSGCARREFCPSDSGIDRRCYSRQGRLRWAKCQPAWRFWSYRGERWREHSG